MEQALILDRYRPLAELGEGGHGSVTLAYDTRMARRVAVKRLPLPLDSHGQPVRKTGLAEARTSAMLNHPNVVTVFEWDTDADEAFLVMEYVEGVSLADVIDMCGHLDPDELSAVVAGISAALGFAHANGVLHLDIKPENVLVTRDGAVKVADFGISALTGRSGTAHALTGTLGYMPIEQLTGSDLDDRTDQWAFAALVYEAATGANPFTSRSLEGALFKARVAEVPAPSEFRQDIPEEVDEALLAALSADPRRRFAEVTALAEALAPALGDPTRGSSSLADTVRDLLGEEPEEEFDRIGLWDRLASLSWVWRRLLAALVCGAVAWVSMLAIVPAMAPRAAGALLVALAAGFASGLGVALATLLFAAAAFVSGPVAGGIALVAVIAHWILVARHNRLDGLAALLAPAMAVGRTAFAVPLLLGFVFEPLPAAVAAAFSALAVSAAAAASGAGVPLLDVAPTLLVDPFAAAVPGWWRSLLDPGVAGTALAWALAGALSSLACGRATRASAIVGGVLGAVTLALAYAAWVAWRGLPSPDPDVLQHLAGSLILFGVVIAAGPPLRGEDG